MSELKYKRLLLKLSGESLMGNKSFGIDPEKLVFFAQEIKKIHDLGVEVGLVIGGGNIFRIIPGPATTNKLEDFFEAGHSAKIEGVAKTFGLGYSLVQSEEELAEKWPYFISAESGKQVLEIITDKELNPVQLKNYFKYLEHGKA